MSVDHNSIIEYPSILLVYAKNEEEILKHSYNEATLQPNLIYPRELYT